MFETTQHGELVSQNPQSESVPLAFFFRVLSCRIQYNMNVRKGWSYNTTATFALLDIIPVCTSVFTRQQTSSIRFIISQSLLSATDSFRKSATRAPRSGGIPWRLAPHAKQTERYGAYPKTGKECWRHERSGFGMGSNEKLCWDVMKRHRYVSMGQSWCGLVLLMAACKWRAGRIRIIHSADRDCRC